jgi:hypothetical protein
MTLRQDELIKKLPENGFNIAKTAREVGYSKQGSRSGTLYASLRSRIEKAFTRESVQAKVLKAERKFIKDNDNSNYARMIELQAKASKLIGDNNIQQVQVNVNDALDALKHPKPIDVSSSDSKG